MARGYALLGEADESRQLISEAKAVLRTGKFAVWCDAMHLYCTALTGDAEATRAEAGEVLYKMDQFPEAREVRRDCYAYIARAAWKLHDWEACRWNAREYETLNVSPSGRAMPIFLLGECARGEGDEDAARKYYAQAAALHPEIYWSRLAVRALSSG